MATTNRIRLATAAILLYILFFGWNGGPAWAEGGPVLSVDKGVYDLAPYTEVLEDSSHKLTVEDVLQPDLIRQFVPNSSIGVKQGGFSNQVHWIRIPIRNDAAQLNNWLLTVDYPPLDHVDFYLTGDGKILGHSESGDHVPFSRKSIRDTGYTFPISLDKGQDRVLLIRIETTGPMMYPIKLADPFTYAERQQNDGLFMGGYFGIMLAMTLYNSILALTLRSRASFYYVLTNAAVILMFATFNGLAYEYLWPNAVWWNNRAIVFFLCMLYIAALLFTRNFLELRQLSRRLNALFSSMIGIASANLLITVFNFQFGLMMGACLFPVILVMITAGGIISLRKGHSPARLFLLGWGGIIMGGMITLLTDMRLTPYYGITENAAQIGSVFEAVVLSLGLSVQIKRMQREKELAVAEMKESRRLAEIDDLTGLYNRRSVRRSFHQTVNSAEGEKMSLLLLDVDYFKQVNDKFGHEAGDAVLRQMAHTLKKCFRPSDIVGRFGGEEFIVLLPRTDMEQAHRAAEYLLQLLRSQPFQIDGQPHICTVSVGIAGWSGYPQDDFERMLRRADEALYEAKRSGRNRICTSTDRVEH